MQHAVVVCHGGDLGIDGLRHERFLYDCMIGSAEAVTAGLSC